jgi:hypothetical protein
LKPVAEVAEQPTYGCGSLLSAKAFTHLSIELETIGVNKTGVVA